MYLQIPVLNVVFVVVTVMMMNAMKIPVVLRVIRVLKAVIMGI
jgi:hypothetical protein